MFLSHFVQNSKYMKDLRKLLEKKTLAKPSALDEKSLFYVVSKVIQQEYGKQGVHNIQPHYYKNKKLFIKTGSSNWANELWLNKSVILKKINDEIGYEEVTDLNVTP